MDKKNFDKKLGKMLVIDELFDLRLYEAFYRIEDGAVKDLLADLIPIEKKHFGFWQNFFDVRIPKLPFGKKLKLHALVALRRIFGQSITHLTLEAREIYGIRNYLKVWDIYKDTALGAAVREVLDDELHHEDSVVSARIEKKVDSSRVRDIFLGLNDGLVEIMGAVSGFFAAFGNASLVLAAGFTVAVAGAFSMAAGMFVAESSGKDVDEAEARKQKFLGKENDDRKEFRFPLRSAAIVGISYFIGAIIPLVPVMLGSQNVFASFLAGGALLVFVSFIVSFVSGMDAKKRISLNVVILILAIGTTYILGLAAKSIWGIAV